MNILILSCGTRSLLVDYFMDRKNGFDRVVTTDCSVYSPALYRADKYYIVPRMEEPGYLPLIMEICRNEDINAVLPLQENELVLIAENSSLFLNERILPIISNADLVNLCRDKLSFYNCMFDEGIPVVTTYTIEQANEAVQKHGLPLFMKPRFGAGSVSSHVINYEAEIQSIVRNENEDFILQPYIEGTEYGINAYVDFVSGKLTELFVLKKIRMRAGETEKSVSIHNEPITKIVKQVCNTLAFRGPIDIDILEKDGNYFILEINPRFGGAYPHTHNCGVNFIKLLAKNSSGKENPRFRMDYEAGIVALRYMTILMMKESDLQNEK